MDGGTESAFVPQLLEIKDLSLEFRTRSGTVHALQGINLEVARGETVGIVGESGSGKSVLSFAILRILDAAAKVTSGSINFAGMEGPSLCTVSTAWSPWARTEARTTVSGAR